MIIRTLYPRNRTTGCSKKPQNFIAL